MTAHMDHTVRENIRKAINDACERLKITLDPMHYEDLSYEYQREMSRVDGKHQWDWDAKVNEYHLKQLQARKDAIELEKKYGLRIKCSSQSE